MHQFCDTGGVCYKARMREWMRETLMRRRSKRGPNESESTGKSGQELPANQLAPLRPNYPEPLPVEAAIAPTREVRGEFADHADSLGSDEGAFAAAVAAATPQIVHETQPESLGTPPAGPEAVSPKSPRGYVVLTIGLPGSGKTTWYKRRG